MSKKEQGPLIFDGVKDTVGKPRLDLISYDVLVVIVKVREYGIVKYKNSH